MRDWRTMTAGDFDTESPAAVLFDVTPAMVPDDPNDPDQLALLA